MHNHRWSARLVVAVAASLLATGALVATRTAPASAATPLVLGNTSWAYVDSHTPKASHLNEPGDVPVGTVVDAKGEHHTARAYFTFDISRLRGTQVSAARLYFKETQATDCVDRQVELWRTDPVDAHTTWLHKPVERQLLGTVGYTAGTPCPMSYLASDATAGLQAAVAAGQSTVTLELRAPAPVERNCDLGRWFAHQVTLAVTYDTAPTVPTDLSSGGTGCAGRAPGPYLPSVQPVLYARVSDPDPDHPTAEFALWPVGSPDSRTILDLTDLTNGAVTQWTVSAGLLADGGSYAWQVRTLDAETASAWSAPCYFQVDVTRPANAPTVTSPDYPADGQRHEGIGIPGTFVFTAHDPDIVGFRYDWSGIAPGYVAADSLGGSATVSLAPPPPFISPTLNVDAIDRAGLLSPAAGYRISVSDTSPPVTYDGTPSYGTPFPVTFHPGVTDRPGYLPVSYTYRVDDGPAQTVPADPDGTASVQVTFLASGLVNLYVSSTGANGWVSPTNWLLFTIDTAPTVTSTDYPEYGTAGGVGVPGAFAFAAKVPGATEFQYSFDNEATVQSVPVGPDGTAAISWTPTATGFTELDVWSVGPDGVVSDTYYYFFEVAG
jgi:hypothetical protein